MNRMGKHALALAALMACATSAMAWHIEGYVYCDDGDGVKGPGDKPLAGVTVKATRVEGCVWAFNDTAVTDNNGYYYIRLPDCDARYCATLENVPADAPVIGDDPYCWWSLGAPTYAYSERHDWLVDGKACPPQCWMTAGGVKFEPVVGEALAEGKNGNGPADSFGGNVYPSCSAFPGGGGHWNHVAHSLNLHLNGQDQTVIRCGNVGAPLPDGTTSPECNVNFIEWVGTGTVSSIKGADTDKKTPVYYSARVEDHAEPGNEKGAKNQPLDLDKYYIEVRRVVDDSLVFQYGTLQAPLSITGGNLQIHCSSCD